MCDSFYPDEGGDPSEDVKCYKNNSWDEYEFTDEYEANSISDQELDEEDQQEFLEEKRELTDTGKNETASCFDKYRDLPLMTMDEEKDYIEKIRKGDQNALDLMIKRNLGLVISIAKRYQGKGCEYEDLVQEGVIGLMTAIDKYDPEKGFKFSTYATYWVRQAITRAISNKGSAVRFPVYVAESARVINMFKAVYFQSNGSYPSVTEIHENTGIDIEMIKNIESLTGDIVSLNDKVYNPGSYKGLESREIIDTVVKEEESVEEQGIRSVLRDSFFSLFEEKLNPKEKFVIENYYGFNERGECLSYTEIGNKINLTRERARQIGEDALKKLRKPSAMRLLRDFQESL